MTMMSPIMTMPIKRLLKKQFLILLIFCIFFQILFFSFSPAFVMAADSASSFEYEDFSSSSYDQTSESDLSEGESDASSGSVSDWSYVPVTTEKKEEQKDLYSMDHRVDFGIHGGYSGIDAMKLDTRWLDPKLDWGGRIRYWLNDSLAFGVTYHRWYHDDNFPASGNYGNVKSGPGKDDFDEYGRGSFRITLNSWDASVYYFMPAGVNFKKWRVYAKGGITTWSGDYNYKHDPFAVSIYPGNENKGTSYASLSLVPGTSKIAAGIDGHDWADFVSSGHTWGFHLGGGIQYWFDPDFSIALESHYKHGHLEMDMAPDLVAGVADKEYLDLSGGYYGLTFNYHFNSPESKTQDQEDEPFPY